MEARTDLVVARAEGLYCPAGKFYIDPWRPVERAVITHAHSDHARAGSRHYLAAAGAEAVLRQRLGDIDLQLLPYGKSIEHHGVQLSLHPAGHVLGSAQVRLAWRGEVWVVSGDYKLEDDGTCNPFEPVRCNTFITESTFGLPIYRWAPQAEIFADINGWWRANAAAGRTSVMFCYAFGKAQRILRGLEPSIGPILLHGAVAPLNDAYRAAGVALPAATRLTAVTDARSRNEPSSGRPGGLPIHQAMVLAPPSAQGTPWMRRLGEHADAFASGWMQLRGNRRRRGVDRGFVLSDHADWEGLHSAISETKAERVIVTHGNVSTMVRWLQEQGLQAHGFDTPYGGDDQEGA